MPKVSIIMPTYNVEPYLEEAMESVTRQTLKDIQIICINDGSTDGSLAIMKRYAEKDPRIILVDKCNEGYGVGMNIGLDRAEGEYIGILEPDDHVPLNMYEDLYNIAVDNDLDIVKADFYRFSRDSETGDMQLIYNHLSKEAGDYGRVIRPYDEPRVTRFIMNTWSGIYRRSFLNEHGIRHNTTPGASFQDNGFFWQTFMYAERVMFVDRPYYMNRRDNPNSSVKNKQKVYCMNVEYDYIREIFMQKGNEELWERFKYYYNRKRFDNYMFTLRRIDESLRKEYSDRICREFKRANDLGELDMELFTELEREKLGVMMKDPEEYYRKYVKVEKKPAVTKTQKLEKELADIKSSKAYKLGLALAYVPRKLDKILKRRK